MPRARTPSRGRSPARGVAAAQLNLLALAIDMEEPLGEALDLVRALHRIGDGIAAAYDEENGRPVVVVAREAGERLEVVQALWRRLVAAAGGGRGRGASNESARPCGPGARASQS
jgi:hypothetical protein